MQTAADDRRTHHDWFALKHAYGLAQVQVGAVSLVLVAECNVPAVVVCKHTVKKRRTPITTEQCFNLLRFTHTQNHYMTK